MTEIFHANRNLNELEIRDKKIKLDSFVRNLIVTLSSRCNLDCIMCEVRRTKWDIPQKAIQEIKGLFPYLERVAWQGGEPFLLEYFEGIFDEAAQFPELKQTIVTNGLLITEKWVEKLVKNYVELTFSIDGITKEVYEQIRTGAKFEDVISSLKIIREAMRKFQPQKMTLRLHVVVMKSNYRQLEGYIDFAKEYGFNAIHLISMWGSQCEEQDIFSQYEKGAINYIENVREKIAERAKKYNIELLDALPISPGNKDSNPCGVVKSSEGAKKEQTAIPCLLPWLQLNIDPGGEVRPGCLCLKSVGSVLKNNIKDLWNNEAMQLYRKNIIERDFQGICNQTCLSVQMSGQADKYKNTYD